MDKLSFKDWLLEMGGATNAIVGSCAPTADYQVQGACSDLKVRRKKKKNEQHESDVTES